MNRLDKHFNESVLELTQLIYAAALDPKYWTTFLEATTKVSGGISTHLFGQDSETNTCLGILHAGYDPAFMQSFNDYYGDKNSWATNFFKFDTGKTVHCELMCPDKSLVKTEFYSDWILPQEDIHTGGGVILFKDQTRMFSLGGNIRRKDSHKLTAPWLRLVTALTPHLQQAFEISRTISGLSLEKLALIETGSSYSAAVFAVTQNRSILYANKNGWDLLESGELVNLGASPKETFAFTSLDLSYQFSTLLAHCKHSTLKHTISYNTTTAAGKEWLCRIVEIIPDMLDFSPIGILTDKQDPFFLITIAAVDTSIDVLARLNSRYAVTTKEAQVALLLTDGNSLHEIAHIENKSIHTIRNQLKAVMHKTGVKKQSELVLLIERLRTVL